MMRGEEAQDTTGLSPWSFTQDCVGTTSSLFSLSVILNIFSLYSVNACIFVCALLYKNILICIHYIRKRAI